MTPEFLGVQRPQALHSLAASFTSEPHAGEEAQEVKGARRNWQVLCVPPQVAQHPQQHPILLDISQLRLQPGPIEIQEPDLHHPVRTAGNEVVGMQIWMHEAGTERHGNRPSSDPHRLVTTLGLGIEKGRQRTCAVDKFGDQPQPEEHQQVTACDGRQRYDDWHPPPVQFGQDPQFPLAAPSVEIASRQQKSQGPAPYVVSTDTAQARTKIDQADRCTALGKGQRRALAPQLVKGGTTQIGPDKRLLTRQVTEFQIIDHEGMIVRRSPGG